MERMQSTVGQQKLGVNAVGSWGGPLGDHGGKEKRESNAPRHKGWGLGKRLATGSSSIFDSFKGRNDHLQQQSGHIESMRARPRVTSL